MILLGSTGSIGINALRLAQKFNINIEVLVAGSNIDLLNKQIEIFKPSFVVIASKNDLHKVKHTSLQISVQAGEEAILEVIEKAKSTKVLNALSGFFGLRPSLKTIECKKQLCLANKESLVVAGEFLKYDNLRPIDSEHFGLWYLLQDKKIHSMLITASGGSFRDYPLESLKNVGIKEALNHPNWSMGDKITIDSATMTNKLYELLEAKHLFKTKKIDAIIERHSLVHALINFKDGSTTAHIAKANMQLPIAYALKDVIDEEILEHVDLLKINALKFEKISSKRYPIWEIKDYILDNPHLGVVLNAANEIAVAKFLSKKISFLDISKLTLEALNKFSHIHAKNIDELFEIDKEVRVYCES